MRAIILGSGSKGNSTLIVGNNKKILIDVGFSYPKMKMFMQQHQDMHTQWKTQVDMDTM